MPKKEKQAFLFHFKWFKRMEKLSPSQKALLLDTMDLFRQGIDIQDKTKKMPEKVLIVWDIIQEDMQEDIQLYESKCIKNRQNASLGGQAKAQNRLANASECYQTVANGSVRCRSLPDKDIDIDTKEKIYKKEKCNCYNFEEICVIVRNEIKDSDVADKFIDFLRMRASLGKNKEVTTQETLDALITKLRSIAKSKQDALSVLNNSIINNLTDLYPPHETKGNTGGIKYAN